MQLSFLRDFKFHKKYIDGVFKTKEEIIDELRGNGVKHIFKVLSFGGGTQSAHLLEQHLQGHLDYDFIVFSDTGLEPMFIHEQVKWWQERQKKMNNQTPFIVTHHKSMTKGLEEMLMRYIYTSYQRFQMPVFCNKVDENGFEVKGGIMPRQCTVDFKIVPVKQTVRALALRQLGLNEGKRMPKDVAFIMDIGFSYDEMNRINTYQSPQYKYMYMSYPLVEQNITTDESIRFLKENQMPDKRSRCYLCPFNCDNSQMNWQEIIKEEPLSFLKACFFDEKIREVQKRGLKMMKSIPYFHYKRQALSTVYSSDFKRINYLYQEELEKWKFEWEKMIKEKYKVAVYN